MTDPSAKQHSDVLVVGAGPVGLLVALLLGQRGWAVTLLERWPAPYDRPRAVHIDDETARLLAAAGLGPQLHALTEPADAYQWRNAAGQVLLNFDWSSTGPGGWPNASMLHQPSLEHVLLDALAAQPHVTLLRGREVVELAQDDENVRVVARDTDGARHEHAATWLIGCDGASSTVRAATGATWQGTDFAFDWLIVDVVPHERTVWTPLNIQVCDPHRPTTMVSGGPGRRRWEFMRLPEETVQDLDSEQTAWQLLAPWGMAPDNCTLERHAVYTFRAQWADRWRTGRVLLAGDSAHLMPPFAGQGMCSGIRDAVNLAWKVDLVLRGLSGQTLLDTYGPERANHVQHAITLSIALGAVICISDPAAAAARDTYMIENGADPSRVLPPLPPSRLTSGLLASGAGQATAGLLTPQGRLLIDGRAGLVDDLLGTRFLLLCATDPNLDRHRLDRLAALGTSIVRLSGPGSTSLLAQDLDGTYDNLECFAQVIRPDHYLFGAAPGEEDLPSLVDDLLRQLGG